MSQIAPKIARNLAVAATSLVLALPFAASVTAQDSPDASTIIATVNGTEITLGHMIMVRAGLPEQYRQLPDDVLFDGILDQLVQQTVLAESADDLSETLRVRMALENERRALLAAEAVQSVAESAVTDAALQAAYQARYAEAGLGQEYNAAHILVETQEEAQAIATELEGGADFAAVAREKSTGPSGPNGGDLGWFGPGMMVAPFQEAVETLEVGAVSAPVETQFGWHVIKLVETRMKSAPPLDQVREELAQQVQQEAVQGRIDGLVESAEITRTDKADIDTSLLQNTDLLDQ